MGLQPSTWVRCRDEEFDVSLYILERIAVTYPELFMRHWVIPVGKATLRYVILNSTRPRDDWEPTHLADERLRIIAEAVEFANHNEALTF